LIRYLGFPCRLFYFTWHLHSILMPDDWLGSSKSVNCLCQSCRFLWRQILRPLLQNLRVQPRQVSRLTPNAASPFFTFLRRWPKSPSASRMNFSTSPGGSFCFWPETNYCRVNPRHGPEGPLGDRFQNLCLAEKAHHHGQSAVFPAARGCDHAQRKLPLVHQDRQLKGPGEQAVSYPGGDLVGQVGDDFVVAGKLNGEASAFITTTFGKRPQSSAARFGSTSTA